ncbi:glycosyltransferase family 4 protein [Marinobacter daepoensis]|uniref:glycosyltransferase family 4 protein n=1 Tax=Marinobacter daepoensis TaxID=262077 RepID=UPI000427348F|nr:glycosyltransferase family 4 protein [Marinobacter daepoensis]
MGLANSAPKIVFVVNVAWYFRLHWLERALAAKAEGLQVYVVSQSDCEHEDREFFECQGLHWVHWPVSRFSIAPSFLKREYQSLKAILDQIQPDIVHSITIKPNLLCGIHALSHHPECRYVQTFPGMGSVLSGKSITGSVKRVLATAALRLACRDVDWVTFENNEDAGYFKRWISHSDTRSLVSLGAGVDLQRFRYTENTKETDEPLRILHAARLLKAKGLPPLVEAVNALKERGVRVELSVAGIPEPESEGAISEDWIKEQHSLGRLRYLGQVSDMVSVIAGHHVVALPTTYGEGIPRILIEAAAMGRCIVATDVSGCRELIEDSKTGLLLKNSKSGTIANRLKVLIETPECLSNIGVQAREKVESGFDKVTVVEQFLSIYRVLVRRS